MQDIIIVGAGPAGLTAAIYGVRANKKVLVLEAAVAGGQIINTSHIDNYPVAPHITGPEFGQTLEKQATELGAVIEYEAVSKIEPIESGFRVITDEGEHEARSVIIATGTSPRKLELEGEEALIGRGISYCATCDGAFYKDKVVAVNGGGNSALHEALYLSDIAKKVYLIHRRDEFRGAEGLVEKIKGKDNIELVLGANISALRGDSKLKAIELDTGRTLEIDGLFVSIGRIPMAKNFVDGLEVAEGDYVSASEDCHTNIPGIFVAGDVRNKAVRQLVTATCDGAIAATEAVNYLKTL